MIEGIIRFSVRHKLIIGLLLMGWVAAGVYSIDRLPVDAVPDITNNQVQVVTVSRSLAPQEVEQFITYPVEVAMANIPDVEEIRSISRFGLSVVTIVFKEKVKVLDARQYVAEQIGVAEQQIPPGLGQPELMPITTGLGEIYQYVLEVEPGYDDQYDAMALRSIQDWIVKRQLSGIPGIIEVSSFGGYLKQYEVALNPLMLQSYGVSITEVFEALAKNNQNSGGSYIEKGPNAYYIRSEGLLTSPIDIENVVVANRFGVPVLIRDVATVQFGHPKRFGAMTKDGKGEAVGGITLMLKGANSSEAIRNVQERVELVRKSLPEGIVLEPYLDRSDLVTDAIHTVEKNLLEGGLIVILVLLVLLGNWRAGLIVASIIPLALLFALTMMYLNGVSANLMSLGAIDFGIVVDGAVIIVEGVLFTLVGRYAGKKLTQPEMDDVIIASSSKLFRSAVFGVFIILVVFVPIMSLTGIEGKMFRPMALTFSFAVFGALILSLTYVPMMSALVLRKEISGHGGFSERLIDGVKRMYRPVLKGALRFPYVVLGLALAVFVGALLLFRSMGAEFIPTLEEGDLAMQMTIQPGSSLQESVATTTKAEQVLLEHFPEVEEVVSKIGTAEVPTDPMAVEDADIMILLKPKPEWTSASDREELVALMKEKLSIIVGASFEFTQPIQLRFNELMTGAKTDIAIKIFGEDNQVLKRLADRVANIVEGIPGAADIRVDQTEGLPQLKIQFNRAKIAEYGLDVETLNTIIRSAYAGEVAGSIYENERIFDLVVRLDEPFRREVDLGELFVHLPDERVIPLSEVASVTYTEGPMQISREDTRRRINVGVNVRQRDVASLVAEIEQELDAKLDIPAGYSIRYGGEFENLQRAQRRLSIAVPTALALIFVLLYFTFGKIKYALMIFAAVPLAAIGGVIALWVRDMPFSISAGVGFIALFGVAVLNGIVLISYFNTLRYEEGVGEIYELIERGAMARLRPVLMTAVVAALGFLPMATSTTNGAEVQKPLATVVIGGLITATLLTLVVMPVLYYLVNRGRNLIPPKAAGVVGLIAVASLSLNAQDNPPILTLGAAMDSATLYHPELSTASIRVRQAELGIEQARVLPPFAASLTLGQMNTNLFDYNVEFHQGLGQIGADRQRKIVARQTVSVRLQEQVRLERQIVYQVTKSWYTWIYQSVRSRKLEQLLNLYERLREKARLQYQLGEANALDQTLADNQYAQVAREWKVAQADVSNALKELRQASWLSQPNWQADTLLDILPLPAVLVPTPVLSAPAAERLALARQQTRLREKELGPSFSFGFFNQSIRPQYSLMGVRAGMEIPLFRKAGEARIQEQQLEQIVAGNQLKWMNGSIVREIESLSDQARTRRQVLDVEGKDLQQQAQRIRELAQRQLNQGEIDYFQYYQSLDAALRSELAYLELVFQYNQAVIDLNFFIQQQ